MIILNNNIKIYEKLKIAHVGLPHSYMNKPPNFSEPQIIYNLSYEGFMKNIPENHSGKHEIIWSVEPPLYILSGQNTYNINCELRVIKNIEKYNIN